jgi:hypothetical protein
LLVGLARIPQRAAVEPVGPSLEQAPSITVTATTKAANPISFIFTAILTFRPGQLLFSF